MRKTLSFKKETSGRWYIVLPNWIGPKSALEMVAGADTFLDHLSNQTNDVIVEVSTEQFKGCSVLTRLRRHPFNGADYLVNEHGGTVMNHQMWLCNVTLFVLGRFPYEIYFSKVA